jgi:hypothetical protein
MFHKLAMLTVMLVCLAAALLLLRQQRLELANRNASLYWEIQRSRQAIWLAESRSAALLRPSELQNRIERTRLGLEPAKPQATPGPSHTDPRRSWAHRETLEATP